MSDNFNETIKFDPQKEEGWSIKKIITTVYKALEEKGYDPKNQIIGYIFSGDPTYITSHKDARNLIRKLDRDEILEELLENYISNNGIL